MEDERWRVAFVRQEQMRAARASQLPRLQAQAQGCIDRAMRLLRECCPQPPLPSPFRIPSPTKAEE